MKDHGPVPSAEAEALLRRWIGLDPQTIGESAIRRAVRVRMLSLAVDDVAAYVRMVEADLAERDRLVEEVVVAESWFFRDLQVYELLRHHAASRLADGPRGDPMRILSAPCAAGEEPYSIAMALLDAGHAPSSFRIDAIDVSHVALAKARVGRYSPNAFRNADSSYRDRWFRIDQRGAVLDDTVKACVNFAWANILEPERLEETLGAGRGTYDIVFCRNLLIYLTPDARHAVERTIDRLLRPGGIVFVGAAEPAILGGGWTASSPGSTFVLRRSSPDEAHRAPVVRGAASRREVVAPPRTAAPLRPPSTDLRGSTPNSGPDVRTPGPGDIPAPDAPSPVPQPAPGTAPATTLQEVITAANALANERRFNEAIAVCEAHQRGTSPDAELYFMMGMIHHSSGRSERAEECFHRALYLNAGHEEALLALSLLADERGDLELAEQYRSSARRVLERKAPS